MSKKLTITVHDDVYEGLYNVVGKRLVSRFLNDLARPRVMLRDLVEGYRAMAADEQRESEALEWVENLTGDIADEPRQAAATRGSMVGRFRSLCGR
jgi:predicted CopG family antitoxin